MELLPVLNMEQLQVAVNEAAMKGALKSIEEYYTGYNSPYRKQIDEQLKEKGISYTLELPDIIATINDAMSTEVDKIANTAIAHSFLPLLQRFLTRGEKEVYMTDILKEFIEATGAKSHEDCEIEMELKQQYGWYDVDITHKDTTYHLTLHEDSESKKQGKRKYYLLSLPRDEGPTHSNYGSQDMELTIEGSAKLKMPFTRDVLKDKFISYCATLLMADSLITIDTQEFSYEMFPHCHCD